MDLSSPFELAGLRPDSANMIQIPPSKDLPPTLTSGVWADSNNTIYKYVLPFPRIAAFPPTDTHSADTAAGSSTRICSR